MPYTLAVMDYESGEIRMFHFVNPNQQEDPEEWLKTHDPKWKDSQCYWMGCNVSDIPVKEYWNAQDIKLYEEG